MSAAPTLDFGLSFRSSADRLKGERDDRRALVKRRLSFGVAYLDDAMGGILPNDLVLLGAKSNIGKTALATIIAMANALAGRRVTYFALEAEDREIERRMKYASVSKLVGQRGTYEQRIRMNFRSWWQGELDDFIGPYEDEAEAKLCARFTGLQTYYRGLEFTVEHLERMFRAVQDQAELIILDHLHYVDIDESESENRATKAIVKRIRDVSLTIGVPVIVIAHLRKKTTGNKSLVPDLDDFHGSSDITKIATKAITLAPAYEQKAPAAWLWPTYVTVPKDRMDGSNRGFGALMIFNARLGLYEPKYELGRFTADGTKFATLAPADLPRWANQAERVKPAATREPGSDDD